MDTDWEDRVRARAYAIWEREGRPEGGAERHWAQAEEELRAEEGTAEAPAAATAASETWTGPGGEVGGDQAAGEDLPEPPAEAAGPAKGNRRTAAKAGEA